MSVPSVVKPYDANFVPTRPGIYRLSWEEYVRIRALNSSLLPLLEKSPLHAYHEISNPNYSSTKDQDIGHAFHCLVLEPKRFKDYVIQDWEVDYTGKAVSKNRKDYQQWRSGLPEGVVVLSSKDLAHVKKMAAKIHQKKAARDLLVSGYPERTCLWMDPDFGFWCKARLDWISTDRAITDLKKTRNASQSGFRNSIWQYKYNWQAFYYQRGVREATGVVHDPFYWIAWEDAGPIEGNVFRANPADVSEAGDRIMVLLEQWAQCLATGEFPGYPDDIIQLGDVYRAGYGYVEDLEEALDDDSIW